MAKYDMQLGNKGIIDDVNSSGDSTYSSEKIESLITESGGFIPDNYYTKTETDNKFNPTNNFKTINSQSIVGSGNIEIQGGGGGTDVIANPELVGTEDNLEGLQVGNTKYKVASGGSNVVVNPILSGDEETATSIKVGDEKYVFPVVNTYGFTPAQITMLEGILRAGTYSSDQSSAITAFIESLQTEPEPAELTSISATVTNLTVEQGQTYVPNATVTAFYSNGTSHDVTAQCSFSTIDTSTTGAKTLTISYTEEGITKTDTKTVTVQSEPVVKTLSSISATKTKTSYNVDETYSNDDVVVTAQYSDSSTANVTTSATIGTIDTSTAGDKTLNISYSEGGITKTTTIAIHVVSGGGEVIYTKSELICEVDTDGKKFGDSHTPWVQGASYKYEFDYEVTSNPDDVAVDLRDVNAVYQNMFGIDKTEGSTGHIEHTITCNATRERQAFVGKGTGYTIKLTNITITKLS